MEKEKNKVQKLSHGWNKIWVHDLFQFFHYDCYQIKEVALSKPNKVVIYNSSIQVKFRVETSIGSSTS